MLAQNSLVAAALASGVRLLPSVITLAVFFTVSRCIYHIYFSPLSHVPGPKLAAATRWYEFYYNALLKGRYWAEIEKMHKVYGPIVRISPYEVHVNDPSYFDELYNVTKKLDKDIWYYNFLERSGSIFATTDADLHRLRSNVVRRFFSVASISKIESLLINHVKTFIQRLEECKQSKNVVPLADAFRSLAVDIVTDYSVPESFNLLETEDFGAAHASYMRQISGIGLYNRFFKWIIPLLERLPRIFFVLQGEVALHIYESIRLHRLQATRVIENDGKAISGKKHPVIMNEVYKSELPPHEKSHKRLFHETAIIIGAGSETTGSTLAMTAYQLLANPDKLKKLKEELATIPAEEWKEVVSYKRIESLSYFNACLSEGLRLALGVSGRLPRVNRHNVMKYKDYVLPPGTAISMTIRDLHYDPIAFPSPRTFLPERWLGADRSVAEKNFAPFSRGSRMCVGKNLAMAELQMAIANVFANFDLELYESGLREVELVNDYFAPFPDKKSKGLQVKVL